MSKPISSVCVGGGGGERRGEGRGLGEWGECGGGGGRGEITKYYLKMSPAENLPSVLSIK